MTSAAPTSPLMVLPDAGEVGAVAVRLRRNGHAVQTGFDLDGPFDVAERRVICAGEISTLDDARAALLAAARGAGLLVAVRPGTDADLEPRFLDDLARIGELRVEASDPEPSGPPLTTEQRQLLDLLAEGASIPAAAAELFISVRTAERRMAQIRSALGVRTTAAAVLAVQGARR